MGDYEQTASEKLKSGRKYTVKQAAEFRARATANDILRERAQKKEKERIEKYGNNGNYINLVSEDRFNGNHYNNVGTTESEQKSYATGYYINGERRIMAKLGTLTPEEVQDLGMYEYQIGISLDKLNLLKSNNNYMAGYMTAMLTNKDSKHR